MGILDYRTGEDMMREHGDTLREHLASQARHYVEKFGDVADIEPGTDMLGNYHFATVTFADGTYRTFGMNMRGEWYRTPGSRDHGGPTYSYTLATVLEVLEELELPARARTAVKHRLQERSQTVFRARQEAGRAG